MKKKKRRKEDILSSHRGVSQVLIAGFHQVSGRDGSLPWKTTGIWECPFCFLSLVLSAWHWGLRKQHPNTKASEATFFSDLLLPSSLRLNLP